MARSMRTRWLLSRLVLVLLRRLVPARGLHCGASASATATALAVVPSGWQLATWADQREPVAAASACGGAHGLYSTVFFLGPHPHAAARLPERERASAARPDETECGWSALVW